MKYLEEEGRIVTSNNLVGIPGKKPELGEKEKEIIVAISTIMKDNMFTPPGLEEIRTKLNIQEAEINEIIAYLIEQGEIIKINESLYFSKAAIEKGQSLLNEYFSREKELTLATIRDILDTSRKYALPLIEYYDRTHFTRRVGDVRVKYQPSR
jgi:selenocysteine-specific elongation factor